MDIPLVVPIDLPTLLTIEDYAPPEPRDAYRVGVDSSELCLASLPYLEWFVTHSLGPLLGVHGWRAAECWEALPMIVFS
jgi:hypothetical protein